jgi:hypothetical protein
MAIEDFTLVQFTGKTVYMVVRDLSVDHVWDFGGDKTFKPIGAATDPFVPLPDTGKFSGGPQKALYGTQLDLAEIHNGAVKSFVFTAYFKGAGAKDPVIDRPAGRFHLLIEEGESRLTKGQVTEAFQDPSVGIGAIRVDQDYPTIGAMCHRLNGRPVDNAEILVYLYDDYVAGRRDINHVVAASRTRVDGGWERAVMRDPGGYAVQFHKQCVAGPDVVRLVVALDINDAEIERITDAPDQVTDPGPPDCVVDGLDEFGGDGLILVDQDYGGPGTLCYTVDGVPVVGAEILLFRASDYNAGNRQNRFAVAASRQLADGTWQQPVKLDPGQYVVQFHKRDVAGPDAFNLTVS